MNTYYCPVTLYFAPRLSRIICISKAVRDNLVKHKVTRENLVLIYNAVDPEVYKPSKPAREVRQELDISASAPVIGMVGNIRGWKGQDVLIRAVARICRQHPDLVCIFVGQATEADSPYLQRLKSLARELGIEGNLRFTGYKKEVANYTNIMDVVVHASVSPEPFGRVLIEAMSIGKPVVGSDAGAVPEILDEPNCGLTFPPGDDAALARAVERILADSTLARTIGKNASIRVRSQFNISENVRRTEHVYSELLFLDAPG